MTEDLGGDAVRYEGDRPVAVGDLRLAQPTRMATTSAGFWGLYEAGDQVLVVHPAGPCAARPTSSAPAWPRSPPTRGATPTGTRPLLPAVPGRRRPGRGHRRAPLPGGAGPAPDL